MAAERTRTMRPDMVFFDVETTAPSSSPDHQRLLEFGAIVVCPRKLVEVDSYHTLIRPADLSAVSKRFTMADDVDVASAPPFEDVADRIFAVLHGRVWAGHNIQRFDCHRIREAFAAIGRPQPEPVAVVDSLNVLAQDFGRRAGDLKMATLASYFGIGKQRHRSLDDARMNLEVLKHCATVLLLESSLPPGMLGAAGAGAGAVTRRRSNGSGGSTVNNNVQPSTPASLKLNQEIITNNNKPVMSKRKQQQRRQGGGGGSSSSSCKRDSVGRVVAERPKEASVACRRPAPTTAMAAAKPCFHMILRHSRTILR
ncbi:hypothetical protein E2562_008502 [Oryza meyeriana var. granulata]|uniref:Exonuclease domain-containing protein n=1 Tax=Oryza meyeriana var. granulata TaxID=110450 RepID=A0A6G1EGK1_9ORYZ|nr:hypothetical protein E2562_008502 [Oryza meyeriana var. granulata]